MPIHLRAEPGDYAEACLLPGDPLRARHIAETFLEGAVQTNAERGMLGYTGAFRGKPVSVQATGMGCPSAAIVIDEPAQRGVKREVRLAPGVLAVEMEAAILFTLGALRGVQTGCLLTVSDVVVEGEFVRISDEEMRLAVDQMTELALATVTADGH